MSDIQTKIHEVDISRKAMSAAIGSKISGNGVQCFSATASGYEVKPMTVGAVEHKMRTFGKDNLMPQHREELLRENYLFSQLLSVRRKITVGSGPVLFEKVKDVDATKLIEVEKKPTQIEEFFTANKVKTIVSTICIEIFKNGGCFVEFTRNKGGKIGKFKVLKNTTMRVTLQDDNGFIPTFLYCGNWKKPNKNEKGENFAVTAIPNYIDEAAKQNKFVVYFGDDFFHDGYYFDPIWTGIDNWLEISNKIPKFHVSNLKNGYFLRMQCEYPHDYFKNYDLDWDTLSEEDKKNEYKQEEIREDNFKSAINKFLEGEENTGRTVFTKYEIERDLGKEFPGIRFKAIEGKIYDESMLKLQEAATVAIVAAAGLPPTLANISIQGKLSSGSEYRNAYNAYVESIAPFDRDLIIENTLNFIHNINDWGDQYVWSFKDVKLETLDDNPAAKADAKPIA